MSSGEWSDAVFGMLLRILITAGVCLPMTVGGIYFAYFEFWIYQHGFFMGAASPGQAKNLVFALISIGIACFGVVLGGFVWNKGWNRPRQDRCSDLRGDDPL